MASAQLAFVDVQGGMNAYDPPHKIATNQVARMVNCALVNGYPTTRPGGRVVPITGPSAETVALANIQGSIFYNPAQGQGGIQFAASNASLALAVGGEKFLVRFDGKKSASKAVCDNITDGLFVDSQNHLVWLSAWEDLLVASDGESKTYIYNPSVGARFSRGYNSVDKMKSEIPNGATVLAYAHAHGVVVVNSRSILVGDSLHRTDFTSSSNLVGFTDQTYWDTGQYFVPPTSMGGINAAAILPIQNTVHGHGDIMFHCENGIFSLDINKSPRSSWKESALSKPAILQAGATGPYAIALSTGDQLYRTRKGAQSLRSAAASANMEGAPEKLLSPEVQTWFQADFPRWLRFAFVTKFDMMDKAFYSTAPIVQGSYRWHRGMVSRNLDPNLIRQGEPAVWEGLWTLPPQTAGIVQTVNGLFDGEERLFAWTRGTDLRNRLVEFSSIYPYDVMEDGSAHPIRCQVITRQIDQGEWWQTREYRMARLYLRGIQGVVKWGVWFRTAESGAWRPFRAGTVSVPSLVEEGELRENEPRAVSIPLGDIPAECQSDVGLKTNESRGIQFLIRWEGYCQLEGLRLGVGDKDLSDDKLDKDKLTLTFGRAEGVEYDDFEYSQSNTPLWITP